MKKEENGVLMLKADNSSMIPMKMQNFILINIQQKDYQVGVIAQLKL